MSDDPIESTPPGSAAAPLRRPRVKFQVFVSSTYVDLHEERERVVWALLEARQIPVGMENFTATDERGWRTITRVIDDTDYYVLILAGLYGSVDPITGMSWTQREYEYATSKGIPVLAFIREQSFIQGDKVETDPDKRKKFQEFIGKVKGNHLCKTWKHAEDLSAAVASALRNAIQDDADDDKSRPGWIRGDSIPSMESFEELARLSADNAGLRVALEAAQVAKRQQSSLRLVRESTNEPVNASSSIALPITVLTGAPGTAIANPRVLNLNAKRNRTIWIRLAVKNSGPVAARDVVVDFRFPKAKGIHLHLNSYRTVEEAHDFVAAVKNSANHCYVDAVSQQSIRQRIKLIVPNNIEPLVRFGVELNEDAALNHESLITGEFRVAAEDGASDSGQFTLTVKWDSVEEKKRLPERLF